MIVLLFSAASVASIVPPNSWLVSPMTRLRHRPPWWWQEKACTRVWQQDWSSRFKQCRGINLIDCCQTLTIVNDWWCNMWVIMWVFSFASSIIGNHGQILTIINNHSGTLTIIDNHSQSSARITHQWTIADRYVTAISCHCLNSPQPFINHHRAESPFLTTMSEVIHHYCCPSLTTVLNHLELWLTVLID